jgi:nicotinamide riboside kinase
VPPWIETEARARLADLYLLCHPDLPWTSDGVRDRPSQREELLGDFRATLVSLGAHVVEISGVGDVRLERARAAVAALLNSRS